MTALPHETRVQTLDEQVRDLARLRLLIQPNLEDEQRLSEGHRTFYAVDANIIHLYISPEQRGPPDPHRKFQDQYGYSTVFQNDTLELSAALGRALSYHILFGLTGADPCFLLPGHNEEVFDYYDRLSRDAFELHSLVDQDQVIVAEAFQRLLALETEVAEEAFEEALVEISDQLFEALHRSDNDRQRYTRLSALISQRRLRSIDSGAHEIAHRLAGETAAKAFDSVHEGLTLGVFRHEWSKRISGVRRDQSEQASNDKQALARLEHINFRLLSTGHRVVLITGDASIREAAGNYFPAYGEGKSFRELYIRHPSAFLSAPEVLRADNASVVNWMDPIFAKVTAFHNSPLEQLRKLELREALLAPNHQNAVEMAASIREQWRRHTKQVVMAHRSASQQMRDYIRVVCKSALADATKPVEQRLSEIDTKLAEVSHRTWDSFFASLTVAGFELFETAFSPHRRRNRLPPPIKLNYLYKTQEFVSGVTNHGLREFIKDRHALQVRFDEIREEDGGLGYGLALAFAMLYADKECWRQTRMLAERAIALTEQREHKICRGREAYFLLAVAQRMLAKTAADFDQARRSIALARQKAATDRIELPEGPTYDFRFDVEEMAIDLSQALSGLFDEEPPKATSNREGLAPLLQEFGGLVQRLADYDVARPEADAGWKEFGIERSVLVKMFIALAVLDRYDLPAPTLDYAVLARRLDRLVPSAGEGDPKLRPASEIVTVVNNYAQARFGELRGKRKKKILSEVTTTRKRLSRKHPDYLLRNFARAYDKQEYRLLLDVTEKHLEDAVSAD